MCYIWKYNLSRVTPMVQYVKFTSDVSIISYVYVLFYKVYSDMTQSMTDNTICEPYEFTTYV